MADAPFQVHVDQDALTVACRGRVEKPAELVQLVVDGYFAQYEQHARAELTSRLALAFEGADEGTRANVAGLLGVVVDASADAEVTP